MSEDCYVALNVFPLWRVGVVIVVGQPCHERQADSPSSEAEGHRDGALALEDGGLSAFPVRVDFARAKATSGFEAVFEKTFPARSEDLFSVLGLSWERNRVNQDNVDDFGSVPDRAIRCHDTERMDGPFVSPANVGKSLFLRLERGSKSNFIAIIDQQAVSVPYGEGNIGTGLHHKKCIKRILKVAATTTRCGVRGIHATCGRADCPDCGGPGGAWQRESTRSLSEIESSEVEIQEREYSQMKKMLETSIQLGDKELTRYLQARIKEYESTEERHITISRPNGNLYSVEELLNDYRNYVLPVISSCFGEYGGAIEIVHARRLYKEYLPEFNDWKKAGNIGGKWDWLCSLGPIGLYKRTYYYPHIHLIYRGKRLPSFSEFTEMTKPTFEQVKAVVRREIRAESKEKIISEVKEEFKDTLKNMKKSEAEAFISINVKKESKKLKRQLKGEMKRQDDKIRKYYEKLQGWQYFPLSNIDSEESCNRVISYQLSHAWLNPRSHGRNYFMRGCFSGRRRRSLSDSPDKPLICDCDKCKKRIAAGLDASPMFVLENVTGLRWSTVMLDDKGELDLNGPYEAVDLSDAIEKEPAVSWHHKKTIWRRGHPEFNVVREWDTCYGELNWWRDKRREKIDLRREQLMFDMDGPGVLVPPITRKTIDRAIYDTPKKKKTKVRI